MDEYDWLTVEDVLIYHETSLEKTGGSEGIRDIELLESAVAKPQNLFAYEDADIFNLAASYAEGISRNHAFIDGQQKNRCCSS